MKTLLALGVQVDAQAHSGTTALHLGVSKDAAKSIELLLAVHADVNKANNDGMTPIYIAAFYGSLRAADLLLDKDAHIEVQVIGGGDL